MKMQHLLEEFDRGEAQAREAMTQDEVVGIIRRLRRSMMHYIGHTKLPQLQRRSPEGPVVVDIDTRWG